MGDKGRVKAEREGEMNGKKLSSNTVGERDRAVEPALARCHWYAGRGAEPAAARRHPPPLRPLVPGDMVLGERSVEEGAEWRGRLATSMMMGT